jgi:error-prone DNA polymerase
MAAVPDRDILADARVDDETPVLGAPSEGEDIVADYNSMSLTLGRPPLSLQRPVLFEQRLMPAATLMTYRSGRPRVVVG